jgi:bifunctional non-homologous end joining protein LigD
MKKLVQAFKKLLLHIGLTPYVLSTGSRGLHIVIPILREHDFSYVRKFAADVAQTIIALKPDAYTMEQSIKKRKGRIFVDINRNALGQLAIAPFSVRAREGAPIAMPLSWNELKNFNPQKYTLKNFRKKNPWKRFDKKCSVKKAYQKLQEFF